LFEHGVILAAGRGERMRPLTDNAPKPLLPSINSCLLGHQIDFIRPFVKNLHITIGYLGSQIIEYASTQKIDNFIDIYQGGNASWLGFETIKKIQTSTLVITCDNIMDVNLNSLYNESQIDSEKSLIVPIIADDAQPGDRILVKNKLIKALAPNLASSLLASGLQVINPSNVARINSEFNDFAEVWQGLIENQQLYISELVPNQWCAIDTPEQLRAWEK
jgi:NDP-sugar pyrophosphorylase family protein